MSDVFNPVSIEAEIKRASNRIAQGVKVCNDRYVAYLKANKNYDVAYAEAVIAYDGPGYKSKYHAVIATADLRDARDVADAAYKYAVRQAEALEDELRALQSVNKSVRQAYNVAGVG